MEEKERMGNDDDRQRQTGLRGAAGSRGRGQDHSGGGHPLPLRAPAEPGAGGPREHGPGLRPAGAGAGHHHLRLPGPRGMGRLGADPAGHAGPRGLLRRDGADAPGAGLRGAGHQRHRRGPVPHPDPLEAAGPLPGPHGPLRHQDGPGPPRPGGAAGRAAPGVWRRGGGLLPRQRRAGRAAGPLRRGRHGGISGHGDPLPRNSAGPAGGPGGLSLLLRLRSAVRGDRGLFGRLHGPAEAPDQARGLRRPGLQDLPRRPGRAPDPPEGDRRRAAGPGHADL